MFLSGLIAAIRVLTAAVMANTIAVNALRKVIRLRTPGLVFVRMVSEGESGMSKFVLVLPAPGAADVVSRELVFNVAGGEPITQSPSVSATESDEFDGNQDDIVTGTLTDVDDAGNRSEPRVFEVVLSDTIAPPQPGEVGVRMTAE